VAERRLNMEEWCAAKMESVRTEWGWNTPTAWMLEALTDEELLALVDFRKAARSGA
jgi:hypothetical protein